MRTEKPAVPGRDPRSNRVIGYAPILIRDSARQLLNDFRWNRMPVDLRIERSMVSAAVELSLEDPELKDQVLEAARAKVIEERETGLCEQSGVLPGYVAVLIRDGLKHQVRYFGSTNCISEHMFQMERVIATAAIEVVFKAKAAHERWVSLIGKTVSWEVGNSYRSARVG